jgi:acyl-CoA hydrolase
VTARVTGRNHESRFQHSFIVSEQATAAIWGHDASSQAGQIIGQVAHPSVREELRQAASDLGFAGDWSRELRAFSPVDQ